MLESAVQGVSDYPFRPVSFTQVRLDDRFWRPRLETNRSVTLPLNFRKSEETGRIRNFEKAAGWLEGEHEGIFYNDSDVYKFMEGAAYSLQLHDDPELERCLDDLIDKVAGAQESDGYLYTARTIDPEHPAPGAGQERWSNVAHGHELYCVGHFYEAAVAHFLATGKRTMLDVAIRNADLICDVFNESGRHDPPGHQEIEMGLVRLFRVTSERRYLEQARFFLEMRGRSDGHDLYGSYSQDHKPVVEQREAVGHAVRAVYMYSSMADVAALTGDDAFVEAIGKIWDNVVERKLSITGGLGARHEGEAFGENYELPNLTAYNETCAAIANVMWNQRMFLLHGDARYVDVLERTLYNGMMSGVSLEGDRFFYPNPLESNGAYAFNHGARERKEWFDTSCCPTNIVRFLPSIPGYFYALDGSNLYVNLFASGEADLDVAGTVVHVLQETDYPWDGRVVLRLAPDAPAEFTLCLRVPGWAQGRPLPGGLYRYVEETVTGPTFEVNGRAVTADLERGYARISRTWHKGDEVVLNLPMPVRRVEASEKVVADAGRVALERGPIVYCAEGVDNGGGALNLVLSGDAELRVETVETPFPGVPTIRAQAQVVSFGENANSEVASRELTLVPYHLWNHRGEGEMAVWLPTSADMVLRSALIDRATASASHTPEPGTLIALANRVEPASSADQTLPRFTWWNHQGSREWVQIRWPEAVSISSSHVYWFDDTGAGECRIPESSRLLYHDGENWRDVPGGMHPGVLADQWNRVEFESLLTDRLRLEVDLQEGFSGGILGWRVL